MIDIILLILIKIINKVKTMVSNRDVGIDLLRIICCFLVVAIHVTPAVSANSDSIASLLINGFVRVGLPIFFVISGMYILNKKIDGFLSFYLKRIPSLLIPFIIYSAIHFFVISFQNGSHDLSSILFSYLRAITSSSGIAGHLWFVYTLLGLYVISPVLSGFISGISPNKAVGIVVFLLIVRAFSQYFRGYFPFLEIPDLPVWMLYFMIGGLIYKFPKVRLSISLSVLAISYVSTCILSYYQIYGNPTIAIGSYDSGINMYVFTISLCLIFKDLEIDISKRWISILKNVSSNTYGAYLIHILVLTELGFVFDLSWGSGMVTIYSFLMTILVFSLSLLSSFIINKIIVNRALRMTHFSRF